MHIKLQSSLISTNYEIQLFKLYKATSYEIQLFNLYKATSYEIQLFKIYKATSYEIQLLNAYKEIQDPVKIFFGSSGYTDSNKKQDPWFSDSYRLQVIHNFEIGEP